MKQILFSTIAIFMMVPGIKAQKYESIKQYLILQMPEKAKEELDKNWSNPKFVAKPEAYILKASILSALSSKAEGDAQVALIDESEKNFEEYLQKDPQMSLIKDPAYANTPIVIYSSLFNRGIGFYNKKDFEASFKTFEKVCTWSEFLHKNGIADIPLDTNAILLAGASAQATEKNDEGAFKYYKKLADNKVGGKDNEFIYRFLARKSFDKEDMEGFERYMALGRELYPEEEFYTYKEEDFVFSIEDKAEKMRRIEGMLKKNPNNFKIQAVYGEILFDELNPRDLDSPLPEGAEEMEASMIAAFTKAAEIEPSNPLAYMNLGNHFMNKSIRANNDIVAHQKMMREKLKAATPEPVKGKPAPKPPTPDPADVEKRKQLQAVYEGILVKAMQYYEKSLGIYENMSAPTTMDKQNWRNAVSNLIDINRELKNAAIRDKNAADEKKFDAAEKKYIAMYASLNKQ
jgi:tetratricopeptide (TPR) repeat protein